MDESNNRNSEQERNRLLSYNRKKPMTQSATTVPAAAATPASAAATLASVAAADAAADGLLESVMAAQLAAAVVSPPPAKRTKEFKSVELVPSGYDTDWDSDFSSDQSIGETQQALPPCKSTTIEQVLAMSDDDNDGVETIERDSDVEIVTPTPTEEGLILTPKEKPPVPTTTDQPWVRKPTRPTKVTGSGKCKNSLATAPLTIDISLRPSSKAAPAQPPIPAPVHPPAPHPPIMSPPAKVRSRIEMARQMSPPAPPRRTMEEQMNARRRAKGVSTDRLVRYAEDYGKTTRELADFIANRYGMTPEEKRMCGKQIRLVRL